jgi:hypothetical protein
MQSTTHVEIPLEHCNLWFRVLGKGLNCKQAGCCFSFPSLRTQRLFVIDFGFLLEAWTSCNCCLICKVASYGLLIPCIWGLKSSWHDLQTAVNITYRIHRRKILGIVSDVLFCSLSSLKWEFQGFELWQTELIFFMTIIGIFMYPVFRIARCMCQHAYISH